MVVKVSVSPNKRCADQEDVCHNRWHPDIKPAVEISPGDEIVLETLDALDGQIRDTPDTSDIANIDAGPVHPLTGPIYVKGAEPGDLLVVRILDAGPLGSFGYTFVTKGFGFLRDVFDKPYKVRWELGRHYASSPDIPGVRIPAAPFPGVIGVAPSREQVREWRSREAGIASKGGLVLLPDPRGAVPSREPIASEGLRTLPPRENGGNLDVRNLAPGSEILFPVFVRGALLSVGDMHYAQGDGEVSVTAIEMGGVIRLSISLIKDGARKYGLKRPLYRPSPLAEAYKDYICIAGLNLDSAEDATSAARDGLLNMIEFLERTGYDRYQAYILFSVAGFLRLSQVVDVPTYTISACIPREVFTKISI
ncbi:MAG: acetamidase/formamidase family protein [Sulfolobales archaeon]